MEIVVGLAYWVDSSQGGLLRLQKTKLLLMDCKLFILPKVLVVILSCLERGFSSFFSFSFLIYFSGMTAPIVCVNGGSCCAFLNVLVCQGAGLNYFLELWVIFKIYIGKYLFDYNGLVPSSSCPLSLELVIVD